MLQFLFLKKITGCPYTDTENSSVLEPGIPMLHKKKIEVY